ncbi:MAG: hypothetical protein ACR2HF_11715 [Methylococcaceae bacterium]
MELFREDFFEKWLDEQAVIIQNKIISNETITAEDKIALILKAQANHFHHLDIEFREEMQAQRTDFQFGLRVLREDMDRRFEQVDRRFEQVDRRFEQVDKRFEQVDKRFEQVDKRLEQIDKRFEQVDERFKEMNDELKKMYQAINTQTWKMIGAIGLIVVLGRMAGNISL